MKLLLLLASLLFAVSSSFAQPIITADRDSVSITYTPCIGETARDTIRIRNAGDPTSLSIRFARFTPWRIVDSSGAYPLSNRPLSTHEEMWIVVQHMYEAINQDTLVISSPSTSLRIPTNAWVRRGKLLVENGQDLHLGKVLVGDTARMAVTIHNRGEVDVVIDHPLFDTNYFKFTDLHKGDTIPAGGSRTAELIYWHTQSIGEFTQLLSVVCRCAQVSFNATVRVYDPRAFWTDATLLDTVRGCPQTNDYTVYLENTSEMPTTIDSITVAAPASDWSIVGPSTSFVLTPGDKLPINLKRLKDGGNAVLTAYAAGLAPERIKLEITKAFAEPRIRTKPEVEFYPVEGESIETIAQVFNAGPWPYRVNKITFEGSPLWSAPNLDTNKTIGFVRSMDIKFKFAGASEGTYTATAYLQGTPCDTVLVQKLTAVVGKSGVRISQAPTFGIYPSIVDRTLNILSSVACEYSIFDVLGNEITKGSVESEKQVIDVSGFAIGAYYLRCRFSDRVATLPFRVWR